MKNLISEAPPFFSSLKHRLMLVFALFSVLLALFYWAMLTGFLLASEDTIFNRQLSLEVAHQQTFYAEHQRFDALPRGMAVYQGAEIEHHPLYRDITPLTFTMKELEGDDLHIARAALPGVQDSFYIVYDVDNQDIDEATFQQFMTLCLLSFLIVAGTGILAGAWIGARTARPIAALDQRVQALDKQGTFGETASFGSGEVGRLAYSFASTYQRLQSFLAREKRFTREVSHELRTPVAVIQGALEILEIQPDNPNACQRIRRASQEMERLIETFLLLGREENLSLSEERLDVCAVCELLVGEHQKNTRVPLRFTLEKEPELHLLPPVFGVLLGNLLSNAVRHTRDGEIEVHLSQQALSVRDTGDGFTPEMIDAVGQPYLNGSQGCGLGLSIVRRICQQFGWRLQVSSTPHVGSEVSILFLADDCNEQSV